MVERIQESLKNSMSMVKKNLLLRDDRVAAVSHHAKTTFKFVEPSGPCFNVRIAELWGRKNMSRPSLLEAIEAKLVTIQKHQEEPTKNYSFFG
jgi:hypothetical protein